MSEFTADEYRAAAKVARAHGGYGPLFDGWERKADEMESLGSQRDELEESLQEWITDSLPLLPSAQIRRVVSMAADGLIAAGWRRSGDE